MKITYLTVLGVLRELYQQPRNMARFHDYITRMTGGGDDIVLPIGVANPMAREQALAKLDRLLALGAEDIGSAATSEAQHRLAAIETVAGMTTTLPPEDLKLAGQIIMRLGDDPPYPQVLRRSMVMRPRRSSATSRSALGRERASRWR